MLLTGGGGLWALLLLLLLLLGGLVWVVRALCDGVVKQYTLGYPSWNVELLRLLAFARPFHRVILTPRVESSGCAFVF
jgi:hypothetical protein